MKDIIRFKRTGAKELIFTKITNVQAIEWCSSDLTHVKSKYFDGFAPVGTYCTKLKPKYAKYFAPNELKK